MNQLNANEHFIRPGANQPLTHFTLSLQSNAGFHIQLIAFHAGCSLQ